MDQNSTAYWGWTTIGVLQCMSAPVANPASLRRTGVEHGDEGPGKEIPALICLTDREPGHL